MTIAKTREALRAVARKIQQVPMLHSLHCISLPYIDYELLCAYDIGIQVRSIFGSDCSELLHSYSFQCLFY